MLSVGALLAVAWVILLALVLVAELVSRNFTGIMRSIMGLGVLVLFIVLAVVLAEYLRKSFLPRLNS